ncbi:MAG: hypothetical protein ACFUZC_16505 [Chthoniobacteraceae bacterium]
MDVAWADRFDNPRVLVLEVTPDSDICRYCYISEACGGAGYAPETAVMTKEEWLEFVDRFADEESPRRIREVKSKAAEVFVEPEEWSKMRIRFALTGNPWING